MTKRKRSPTRKSLIEGVFVSGVLVAAALLIYAFAPVGIDTLGLFVLTAAPVAGAASAVAVWLTLKRGAEPAPARLSGSAAVVVGVLILFVLPVVLSFAVVFFGAVWLLAAGVERLNKAGRERNPG